MKLKRLHHYLDFMEAVQRCEREVFFNSAEGDNLNLKSTMCQYLFAAACGDRDFLEAGEIVCESKKDYARLQPYLEGGPSA